MTAHAALAIALSLVVAARGAAVSEAKRFALAFYKDVRSRPESKWAGSAAQLRKWFDRKLLKLVERDKASVERSPHEICGYLDYSPYLDSNGLGWDDVGEIEAGKVTTEGDKLLVEVRFSKVENHAVVLELKKGKKRLKITNIIYPRRDSGTEQGDLVSILEALQKEKCEPEAEE
jgi:hypothetical protein